MSKHTPEPWTVDREATEWHRPNGVQATAIFKYTGRSGLPIAWVHPYLHLGDPQADAHLIAAAPDLLAALYHSLDWLASYPGEGAKNAWKEAHAAIAKAEGTDG